MTLTFWPEIHRAHPRLMGSLCMKFHDDMCKGKANMQHLTIFSNQCIKTLTFDPKIHRAHPRLMGSLCMKFHDDKWKGKAIIIMRHKSFSVINAFWPWPLNPKINRAYPQLMGSLCVKFHDDRCKGKAVMQLDHFTWPRVYRRMDGQTDRQADKTDRMIPVYPLASLLGVINIATHRKNMSHIIYTATEAVKYRLKCSLKHCVSVTSKGGGRKKHNW